MENGGKTTKEDMSPPKHQTFKKSLTWKEKTWFKSTRGRRLKEGGKKERKNRKRSPKLKQTFVSLVKVSF